MRLTLRRTLGWLLGSSGASAESPRAAPPSTVEDDRALARFAEWDDVFLVTDLLERHGVDYVLVGAYALSFNGIVRQTGDVDVLVADEPVNNARWIEALSQLPDGVVGELRGETDPFRQYDAPPAGDDFDDEPGVIRVADRFVVDVMPRACGLTIDDLRGDVVSVTHEGRPLKVLSLAGMRKVKQGVRPKDRADLRLIEIALATLGDPHAHADRMATRSLAREPRPAPREVLFRDVPEVDDGTRIALARAVVARAARDGDASGHDAATLAVYCGRETLEGWLASEAPLDDLDASARDEGVILPSPR